MYFELDDNIIKQIQFIEQITDRIDLLEKFSVHDNHWIRGSVAQHPKLPNDILENLSKDKEWYVRHAVAISCKNNKILQTLSKDTNFQVRSGVSYNHYAPKNVLIDLSKEERMEILEEVAKNPNTPNLTLSYLCQNSNSEIRLLAFKNLSSK